MYIPRSFGDPEKNFWNLVNGAILCDVAVERQVEITGPDAAKFVQLLTPRNLKNCQVGQCKYVLITSPEGGIINDPVLLKLGENHFWLSLADSDVLLWAKGVQVNSGLEVSITEPDVSPLQLQGPKSRDIMLAVFGSWIQDLRYYFFKECELNGIPLVVSRTGWSSELGYEIFLRDGSKGYELWQHLMSVGGPMGLSPGHTSTIRRIEGGMMSYVADATINNNPYEFDLGRLIDCDMDTDFIGKHALRNIQKTGVHQKQVGIVIGGSALVGPNDYRWELHHVSDGKIGEVTSAIYSPRLNQNIALALVDVAYTKIGTTLSVLMSSNEIRTAEIVKKPFYDPQKKIAAES